MSEKLSLGVSRAVITPKIGGNLFGYNPNIYSTAVRDDLTATVFVFKQGGTSAMLITCTVGNINNEIDKEIRELASVETGIKSGNIILAATHTHSAPNLAGMFGWGDVDREYYTEIFRPSVLSAVKEAAENMQAVTVGYAQGESLVGINRRQLLPDNTITLGQNPWGPVDKRMTVISFRGEDGKNVANLIHYGCHGTASGWNTEVTRDWAGVMTDVVERDFGGITAFINGAEGDVGPRNTNGKTTGCGNTDFAIELGGYAARDAMTIADKVRAYRNADLAVYGGTVSVPLGKRIPYEEAKAEYERTKENTVNQAGKHADLCRRIAESYENGYVEVPERTVPQTIIRIGDIAIVSFPYELFCEISMRIDTYCTDIPYVLSLSNSNGCESYLATQDQICRGGYEIRVFNEANIQPYAENVDYALICATLENLKNV